MGDRPNTVREEHDDAIVYRQAGGDGDAVMLTLSNDPRAAWTTLTVEVTGPFVNVAAYIELPPAIALGLSEDAINLACEVDSRYPDET